MAKLVVLTEGFAGTVHELKSERTTVGRLEDNVFQIAESSVSSHHCELVLKGNEVEVKDLNSTNGTFIANEPISHGLLKPGQILRLGSVEMRLENGAASGAQTAAAAATAKKQQTMPIGGVRLGELENAGKTVNASFAKKSDKTNKIFLYGGLGLGAVIIALIVYAILQVTSN